MDAVTWRKDARNTKNPANMHQVGRRTAPERRIVGESTIENVAVWWAWKALKIQMKWELHISYKDKEATGVNGSTATTRWYRFLIVVKWGFESLAASHRLLLDLVRGITMPLRCFYSVWHLSAKTGSYLVSILHFINNVLHNCGSSSVKIGCTIRICSSTVERRRGIIRRQERPTRLRSTKNENCEYNFSLKCILVNSPGEEVIVFLLFRFIFSFVRSVREYRAP